jgi:hypothetical protein
MTKKKKNLLIAFIIFVSGITIVDMGDFGFGDTHTKRAFLLLAITILISLLFFIRAFRK